MENTKNYTIKTEGKLSIPIFNLISVIYEIDLFKDWIPFCTQSEMVYNYNLDKNSKQRGESCSFWNICSNVIPKRSIFIWSWRKIFNYKIDRLDYNGTITIIGKSIDNVNFYIIRMKIIKNKKI